MAENDILKGIDLGLFYGSGFGRPENVMIKYETMQDIKLKNPIIEYDMLDS